MVTEGLHNYRTKLWVTRPPVSPRMSEICVGKINRGTGDTIVDRCLPSVFDSGRNGALLVSSSTNPPHSLGKIRFNHFREEVDVSRGATARGPRSALARR